MIVRGLQSLCGELIGIACMLWVRLSENLLLVFNSTHSQYRTQTLSWNIYRLMNLGLVCCVTAIISSGEANTQEQTCALIWVAAKTISKFDFHVFWVRSDSEQADKERRWPPTLDKSSARETIS